MDTTLLNQVANYQPSPEAIELVTQTSILLLVGISGAGKDTVRRELVATGKYHSIVSHTTRAPRINHGIAEQEGLEYHFISMSQALQMVADKAFIEAKCYGDNIYGTSLQEIQQAQESQKVAVADIEVQGVAEYKQLSPKVKAVFLLPPNYEIWQARLRQRYEGYAVNETDIAKRMRTAQEELAHALDTNYFHFVVNNDLSATVQAVDEYVKTGSSGQVYEDNRQVAQKIAQELSGTLDD